MSLNGKKSIVERTALPALLAILMWCTGAGCGGVGANATPEEPLDVVAELDLLNACAIEELAAVAPLERVFAGQRRATTEWIDAGEERVRYASSVYLHPRFGPALTVEPFRQRWVGAAEDRAPDAPVHRAAPEDGVSGWLPVEFRPEDRELSEQTVFRAAECWRERR